MDMDSYGASMDMDATELTDSESMSPITDDIPLKEDLASARTLFGTWLNGIRQAHISRAQISVPTLFSQKPLFSWH